MNNNQNNNNQNNNNNWQVDNAFHIEMSQNPQVPLPAEETIPDDELRNIDNADLPGLSVNGDRIQFDRQAFVDASEDQDERTLFADLEESNNRIFQERNARAQNLHNNSNSVEVRQDNLFLAFTNFKSLYGNQESDEIVRQFLENSGVFYTIIMEGMSYKCILSCGFLYTEVYIKLHYTADGIPFVECRRMEGSIDLFGGFFQDLRRLFSANQVQCAKRRGVLPFLDDCLDLGDRVIATPEEEEAGFNQLFEWCKTDLSQAIEVVAQLAIERSGVQQERMLNALISLIIDLSDEDFMENMEKVRGVIELLHTDRCIISRRFVIDVSNMQIARIRDLIKRNPTFRPDRSRAILHSLDRLPLNECIPSNRSEGGGCSSGGGGRVKR